MGYIKIAMELLSTSAGKKAMLVLISALFIFSTYLYVSSLKSDIRDYKDDLKSAEDSIVLINNEFSTLYDKYSDLEKDFDKEKKFYEFSISELNKKHKRDVSIKVSAEKLKDRIKNAKDKDDGEIATVLDSTLESIRMFK